MPDQEIIRLEPHARVLHVVVLPRRLDTAAATKLEDEISHALLAHPDLPLVLDLGKVKFAPSVALGALVSLFKHLSVSKREAALVGLNHQIRGTMSVTRLDSLIEVHPNLESAIEKMKW